MDKNKIITRLIHSSSYIYGTSRGIVKWIDNNIIPIRLQEVSYTDNLFFDKGPALVTSAGVAYHFDDYGKTWAFTKEELKNE